MTSFPPPPVLSIKRSDKQKGARKGLENGTVRGGEQYVSHRGELLTRMVAVCSPNVDWMMHIVD